MKENRKLMVRRTCKDRRSCYPEIRKFERRDGFDRRFFADRRSKKCIHDKIIK